MERRKRPSQRPWPAERVMTERVERSVEDEKASVQARKTRENPCGTWRIGNYSTGAIRAGSPCLELTWTGEEIR